MADKNYDLIIVGSGMAGFLLAARIAEKGVNPRNGEPLHGALVERGPYLPGTPRPGYGAGSDPRTSVVNPYFESHDVENLLICDASVTPMGATIGYGAPTATVASFAYRRIS